jgi:release factor glutamine methyltransferase
MPKMPAITICNWLRLATDQLESAGVESFHLDAELILANSLKKDRTYLHANPEQIISSDICSLANKWLKDRKKRIPLAYIFGHKEFYGRNFLVNRSVLIPRPESEDIINLLLKLRLTTHTRLVDVGTGSGCLGITAKLEIPDLKVELSDISNEALAVAKQNATKLIAPVDIIKSDLLSNIKENIDIIVSNLPYVDKSWERSIETNFEPEVALFAKNNGLEIIYRLIDEASVKLANQGLLILESDITQTKAIIQYAKKNHFKFENNQGYITAFSKL